MKIIKYGSEFPAISDYDIVSKIDEFCKDLDLIETSNFLIVDGVRAMICKGELNHEEVEFHFTEVEEVERCDREGKMKEPRIYGLELLGEYLDILIGLK